MNALDLLKTDHRNLNIILDEIAATSIRATKKRLSLLEKAEEELLLHEKIEEKFLYPRLKENKESRPLALEAYEEHHCVNLIMQELKQTPADDESWIAKFTVMRENINHHIKEEEKELFKITKQLIDKQELIELGQLIQEFKKQFKKAK